MEQTQDERQRVDRWLEESQYLIGRLIPAYLEDRDRCADPAGERGSGV